MSGADPTDPPALASTTPEPLTLEGVVSELRRLALAALDAGHPLAAAEIAGTADRLEARAWPARPPRPNYPPEG